MELIIFFYFLFDGVVVGVDGGAFELLVFGKVSTWCQKPDQRRMKLDGRLDASKWPASVPTYLPTYPYLSTYIGMVYRAAL